jgi:hypothetical protein
MWHIHPLLCSESVKAIGRQHLQNTHSQQQKNSVSYVHGWTAARQVMPHNSMRPSCDMVLACQLACGCVVISLSKSEYGSRDMCLLLVNVGPSAI